MTMPFYVSPEQQMRDRADYVRKNIARGKGAIVLQYEHGIALVAENRAPALHKISEIYDRIGFAAIGKYNEFETLRTYGVRQADLQGYSFDRTDVTALMLANRYANILGTIFSGVAEKPYEVEIFVAEVGETSAEDQIYRITYDGSVLTETGYAVMGGAAEQVSQYVSERYQPGQALAPTLQLAVEALGHDSVPPREPDAAQLEVAVLDRTRPRPRKFKRIVGPQLDRLLSHGRPAQPDVPESDVPESDVPESDVPEADQPAVPTASESAAPPSDAESAGDAESNSPPRNAANGSEQP